MDFGPYIGVGYVGRGGMGGGDLNNRRSTLKTLSTNGIVVRRIENKKLKRLMYILN
jgi:hypothetical protein